MSEQDLSTLRTYLAERDAPCPGCGYNLRGTQEPVCPECGGPVELSVGGSRSGKGYLIFLLVVFAWVGASAGMNAAREARAALTQSRILRGQSFTVRTFSGGVSMSLGGSTTSRPITLNGTSVQPPRPITSNGTRPPSPIVINGTTVTTVPAAPSPTAPRRSTMRPATGGRPSGSAPGVPLSAPVAGPIRSWAQVGWPTWLGLGWWGFLGIAGLTGLVVVVLQRRRVVKDGPGMVLFAGALALAALHVSFQVFLFVRELGL